MLLKLAFKSLNDRRSSVMLTILSLAIGMFMLISFSFIKEQVKNSFTKTISGIDLIVGAKTSEINLLLYSVFQIGAPANNIDWEHFEALNENPMVDWVIPISLGDSHKGFRVIGTSEQYFKHYKYGKHRGLELDSGDWFNSYFGVVLGHDVAANLNYTEGDRLTLSHGVTSSSFTQHDEAPFEVQGVLKKTGTPVDKSLFVSLIGLEAVHLNWPRDPLKHEQLMLYIRANGLPIKSITTAFIGLMSKSSTFVMQRTINDNNDAGLMAVLPGVALAQIWRMSSTFENVLMLVGFLVLISTLIGLVTMLVSSLQSRKKELALLRIIGASPLYCMCFVQLEAMVVLIIAFLSACLCCLLGMYLFADLLGIKYGLFIEISDFFNFDLLLILSAVFVLALIFISIPSMLFYKQSIHKSVN